MIPEELARSRYVSLTTFRRDGGKVPTPVWAVEDEGELLVWTRDDSWKVKRLRKEERVGLSPCDVRGNVAQDAPHFEGTGRLMTGEGELERVRRAMAAKYGWQFRLTDTGGALLRLGKRPHVGIAISL